jgi:hypothetical protein
MSSVIVFAAHLPLTAPPPPTLAKVYGDNIDIADDGIVICMGTPKKPDGRVANIRSRNPSRSTLLRPLLRMLSSSEHLYPRTLPFLMLSQIMAAAGFHNSST